MLIRRIWVNNRLIHKAQNEIGYCFLVTKINHFKENLKIIKCILKVKWNKTMFDLKKHQSYELFTYKVS